MNDFQTLLMPEGIAKDRCMASAYLILACTVNESSISMGHGAIGLAARTSPGRVTVDFSFP